MENTILQGCNDEEWGVAFFKELLRFKTVSGDGPKGAYSQCCLWLKTHCEALGLEVQVVEFVKNKPVVIATLRGTDPALPSVVLNSHYDVVPAMLEHWTVDPWGAIEKDGKIYGRGTQDMKSVCAQYLLAVGRLLSTRKGKPFLRTIHLTFVPDEETGGKDGMSTFVKSPEFQQLKPIGVALDEGLANPENKYTVFYGERAPIWIMVTAKGPTGHGSRFVADTAVEKLIGLSNKALEFRSSQEAKLGYKGGCKHCEGKKLGDVTTLNLTMLKTGVSTDEGKTYALNVIPTEAQAGFDIRVATTTPMKDIAAMMDQWCEAEGLSWKYAWWAGEPMTKHVTSSIDEKVNPFWGVFKSRCNKMGIEIVTEIFPAGTDSRFLRGVGIPAFGFSPMANSPILLHEHDEYLERGVFLEGIGVYTGLIEALADAVVERPSSL